ncbi:unnamed protein product [Chrysoparadoxa australica]
MANDWKRTAASVLIALVYECSVLLFTANSDKLGKGTSIAVAWTSFIINLFFWQAWDPVQEGLVGYLMMFFKVFASALIAWLNYTYADLFVKLWKERMLLFKYTINQKEFEELMREKVLLRAELSTLNDNVKERKSQIEKTTCPHCRQHYPSQAGFNSHVGKCSENPKNQ